MRLNTLYPVCPSAARPNWSRELLTRRALGTRLRVRVSEQCTLVRLVEDYGSKRSKTSRSCYAVVCESKRDCYEVHSETIFWTRRRAEHLYDSPFLNAAPFRRSEWWTLLLKRWQNYHSRSQSLLTSYGACSMKTNALGGDPDWLSEMQWNTSPCEN